MNPHAQGNPVILWTKRIYARFRFLLNRAGLAFADLYVVFYPFLYFGMFAVVESVKGAHKIAGDAADPLERDLGKAVIDIYKIAVQLDLHVLGFFAVFF